MIFRIILPHDDYIEKTGDLEEVFYYMKNDSGRLRAYFWLWVQILRAAPVFMYNSLYWSVVMFGNYLKVTLRNIARHKGYSLINITGLAVGMACSILIFMWVQDEIGYDRYHEHTDDLYLVATMQQYGSRVYPASGTVPALGPALESEYPEILNAARMNNGQGQMLVTYGDRRFTERIQAGDIALLEIFSFPMVMGDLSTAFNDPHSIIMTEPMAEKYFGKDNPIGRTVTLDNTYDMTVTGVIKEIPRNSTWRFSFLVPLDIMREMYRPNYIDTWYNLSFRTFVLLDPNASPEEVSEKIRMRIKQSNPNSNTEAYLFPYGDYRLYGLRGNGRIAVISTFSIIALFVLLIACINFMNLSTARSGRRAKEIGMRKVVGAGKQDIINLFYGESIMMSVIALAFAVLLVQLFLPAFNNLSGKQLSLGGGETGTLVAGILGITLLTGIVSGSYPALFLSSFKPVAVIRGILQSGAGGSKFRKSLVVLQFTMSIGLIISTIVVFNQVSFMRTKDMGIDREQMVQIRVKGGLKQQLESVKQEMLRSTAVGSVTVTQAPITAVYWNGQDWEWDGRDPDTNPLVSDLHTDYSFTETFSVEVTAGRFYSKELDSGKSADISKIVINEAFARIMEKENPTGERIFRSNRNYIVIGVVKDFSYTPLYQRVGPLMIYLNDEMANYMYVKIQSGDVSAALSHIETVYSKFNPDFPFEFTFLDDEYSSMYREEQIAGTVFRYFAALAVILSCLGLFGLASFTTEQRTKEIGVRKTFGASVPRIVVLLSKDFTKWVIAANILAWPISWFLMSMWLNNYAFRINLSWWIFVVSGAAALVVALLTVSYQAVRAARANPVNALKYE